MASDRALNDRASVRADGHCTSFARVLALMASHSPRALGSRTTVLDSTASASDAAELPATSSATAPHDEPRTPLAASGPSAGPVASTSTLAPILSRRTSRASGSSSGSRKDASSMTLPIDIAAPSPAAAYAGTLAPASSGAGRSSRTPSPTPSGSSSTRSSSPLATPLLGGGGGQPKQPPSMFGTSLSPTLPQHHFATSAPSHFASSASSSSASTSGRAHGGGAGSARMTNGYSQGSSSERTPVLGYSTSAERSATPSAGPAYHVGFGSAASLHHQQQGAVLLSSYLAHTYLPSIMPSPQEYAEKESTRQSLEALAKTVLPGCSLVAFGSTANGLSLRNSGAA